MQWTNEKTTRLGTYHERRGKWHGIPYVIRANSTKGMTTGGWVVVILVVVLLMIVTILEELI